MVLAKMFKFPLSNQRNSLTRSKTLAFPRDRGRVGLERLLAAVSVVIDADLDTFSGAVDPALSHLSCLSGVFGKEASNWYFRGGLLRGQDLRRSCVRGEGVREDSEVCDKLVATWGPCARMQLGGGDLGVGAFGSGGGR